MFDNILSTSLFLVIAAVAAAAGLPAGQPSVATQTHEIAKIEVVTLPTVVVTGRREVAVAAAPQVVQFPKVMVTGHRAPVLEEVTVAMAR